MNKSGCLLDQDGAVKINGEKQSTKGPRLSSGSIVEVVVSVESKEVRWIVGDWQHTAHSDAWQPPFFFAVYSGLGSISVDSKTTLPVYSRYVCVVV
jgi:hypothetical protein